MGETTARGTEAFDLDEYHGEHSLSWRPTDLEKSIASLVSPSTTSETLHWGRNYLYSAPIDAKGGSTEVVVKQFRNQGLRRRWERRLKGSKAWRSWRVSVTLQQAEIATPEPMVWIESRRPEGPSFFVSRRLPEFLEARYYFRALEAGCEERDYPQLNPDKVIEQIGSSIRRLHDAGIWHRDLSIGNVLLVEVDRESGELEVHFIDLNRARLLRRLTTWQRTRDLCRLRIFRTDLQEKFLHAYWGSASKDLWRRRLLYRLLFRTFLFKVWLKRIVRQPFRGLRDKLGPRHPHVHIPQAPESASRRDRAVWDGLSDQPHQHATRMQRLAVRIRDAPHHGREIAAGLAALPRIRRRFSELKSELYAKPIDWGGMGIALRPWPKNPEGLLGSLEELGTRQVFLRLHPWQENHTAEEELAGALHQRGFELAFALPQNREMVRDLPRWRAAVTELAERFGRFGRYFQVGQAINRSKWGVWNYREYIDLATEASEILRQDPQRRLLGPAVIDYEPLRTAGVLNVPQKGVYFDILASLLYVDRRGAPENTQLGFDTVDKVTQMRAIAEISPACGDRSWITETNWPLWEGPHSPAGRKVSVDEETQANYLARYFLLTLGTGLVERVYWWQLIARGYGLTHEDGDGKLRRRPGFAAFATLHRLLEGATFLGPVKSSPPQRLYRFRTADGAELVAAWSADDTPVKATLPRAARRAVGLDGWEGEVSGPIVEVAGAPRFFWLESG